MLNFLMCVHIYITRKKRERDLWKRRGIEREINRDSRSLVMFTSSHNISHDYLVYHSCLNIIQSAPQRSKIAV
jgi:hypothetical protein